MIDIEYLKSFYPPYLSSSLTMQKNILKEYIELLVLDYLVTTPYIQKLTFIGGTNLRLIKGIQRFSEDLDFDCKNLTEAEFIKMTDSVVSFLKANGFSVETNDKENPRLTAYRRNILFPGLLYEMGLTRHKEERFLLKIEAQDQGVDYAREVKTISRNGFHFMVPSPSDATICAMKLVAVIKRGKGRDFYDSMFLLQQTTPDYSFLEAKAGVSNTEQLKNAIESTLAHTDLNIKQKDFVHLAFNPSSTSRILDFKSVIDAL